MSRRVIEVGDVMIRVTGRLLRTGRLEGEGYEFVENPAELVAAILGSGERIDLFTFAQRLPDTSPKYSYPMEWANVAALPVSTFEDWWTTRIDASTRNKVRKSEKHGVTVHEVPFDDTLVEGIWRIYNETAVRQGKPNRHYGKDLAVVRREAATFLDGSIWIGAFADARLIGFAKLTSDKTRTQAGLMNIVATIRDRDRAPTNALIAQAVRVCADRGILFLVYGSFSYGKKQRDTLSDFKKHNGFTKIEVPRYYVPMTRLGSAAFRAGLHKRLADRIPEPVLAGFRRIRRAWYNRSVASVADVS